MSCAWSSDNWKIISPFSPQGSSALTLDEIWVFGRFMTLPGCLIHILLDFLFLFPLDLTSMTSAWHLNYLAEFIWQMAYLVCCWSLRQAWFYEFSHGLIYFLHCKILIYAKLHCLPDRGCALHRYKLILQHAKYVASNKQSINYYFDKLKTSCHFKNDRFTL